MVAGLPPEERETDGFAVHVFPVLMRRFSPCGMGSFIDAFRNHVEIPTHRRSSLIRLPLGTWHRAGQRGRYRGCEQIVVCSRWQDRAGPLHRVVGLVLSAGEFCVIYESLQ